MPWAKIDDGFDEHPKVESLIDEEDSTLALAALGLWTVSLVRAHREMQGSRRLKNKTPGLIQRSNIRRYTDRENREELAGLLVKYGLWETHDDGWIIHDFADYLPSTQLSEVRSKAGKKGATARYGKVYSSSNEPSEVNNEPSDDGKLPVDGWQTVARARPRGGNPEPEPEVPTTKVQNTWSSAAPPTVPATVPETDSDFDRFWAEFPRKTHKVNGRKAWAAAMKKKIDPEVIIEGAIRFAESERGTQQRHMSHAATWINGERWNDEPATNTGRAGFEHVPFWEA
jgi:hypothetical protein